MSHINITSPRLPSDKTTLLNCGAFNKGVVLCEHDRELLDGQSPIIKNMIYNKNMLRTRPGQCSVENCQMPDGKLHSVCSDMFFNKYVLHIGGALYSFDGTELVLLNDTLPDCDSFVFEMNSKLYFFCSEVKIFIVDKDFDASEYVIKDLTVATDAKYNLTSYTAKELPDNMLSFRINVVYSERDAGIEYYVLPSDVDTNYEVIFKNMNEGKIRQIEYTVEGNKVILKSKLYVSYQLSYVPAKGTEYRNFDKIFGCTKACTYGGNTSGGTRVFLTGNKEYPGYYFHSELLSPLHFKKLSYDIIGNGSESINCIARQKSDLIAFCDKSVYRISYSFDAQDGPDFTVSEISTRVGCDIPDSVQLIDNRLVFANSSGGVYMIISSDFTDELSIRRISANINGFENSSGFLSEQKTGVENSISIDFDRKYILVCPSGNAYIWDYGNSPYVAGDDPLLAEKRLCWYFYDSIKENSLFEIDGELYGTRSVSDKVEFVCFSELVSSDFDNQIESVYKSCEFDLGESFAKKVPEELYLNVSGRDGAIAVIDIYADGDLIAQNTYAFMQRDAGTEKLRRILIKIPGYELYRISFAISVTNGRLGVYDAGIKFKSKEIYYR